MKELKEIKDGTTVIIGGLANSVQKRLTRKNKLLGIVHMEDLTGKCEAVIYSDILEQLDEDVLTAQSLLLIKGKIKKFEDSFSVITNSVRKIADASLVDVFINKEQSFSDLHRLKDILNSHKGEDPVMLHFNNGKRNRVILVGSQFWVQASKNLVGDIATNFGTSMKVSTHKIRF